MIQGFLSDPSLIPVTIVFILFILFSYWQNLRKYIIHLSIVYISFLIFTATSYSDHDNNKILNDVAGGKDSLINAVGDVVLLNIDSTNTNNSDLKPSEGFKIKEFIPKSEVVDNSPKTISVQRLIVCENINFKLRKPIRIRDVFLDSTSKIYCFAGIKNPDKSENITHYWEFNGEPYAKVHMNISVSEYFRCWSYVTPREGYTGLWSVSVIDDQNNLLKKQEFSIISYDDNED